MFTIIILFIIIILLINRYRYNEISYLKSDSWVPSYEHDNFFIFNIIFSAITRFYAVQKAAPFLKKTNHLYFLRNNNTAIKYDSYLKQIKCMDKTSKNKNIIIEYSDYGGYWIGSESSLKKIMDDNFNHFCYHFNADVTFDDFIQFFKENYKFKEPYLNHIKTSKKNQQYMYVDEYFSGEDAPKKLIDINTASLEEIRKLPGINVIMAKRMIKYREEHNGFKSLEELYSQFKIKKHFTKQLDGLIIVFNNNPNPEANSNLYTENDYFGYNKEEITNNADEIPQNSDRIIDI